MGEFVGGRIVPKHCGAWNKNSKYEMLSIVYQPETGDSYISRKSVPAGTALNSEEYWAICSEYPHRSVSWNRMLMLMSSRCTLILHRLRQT